MTGIESLITSFQFRLGTFTIVDVIDIVLVTLAIYLLLSLLRRSQAAFLLRGIVVLALIFLVVYLLLPLPTFSLILSVAMVGILIAIPITLQPELRHWLERFGRQVGFSFSSRENVGERVISPIMRAVNSLSSTKTGALIILEGSMPLDEIISRGVPINGRVTSELLGTIFFDKTPLHDGAVIIRADEVVAAGCVLPLSEKNLTSRRRLGTRHRAAVGLSEVTDALVIVVSEETGSVSVAHEGHLDFNLDRTVLHQRLTDLLDNQVQSVSISRWRPWSNWHFRLPTWRGFLADLVYLLFSFILALFAATAVSQQTNPLVRSTIDNIRLDVLDMPAGTILAEPLPKTVTVQVQTTAEVLPTLSAGSFQATTSLNNVTAGPNRVPVTVATSADKVLILEIIPEELDVVISPIVSQSMTVSIQVDDADMISAAYEISGAATVQPKEVIVTGSAMEVEQVAIVEAAVSVANATTVVRQTVPIIAYDAAGEVVNNVTIDPAEAEVMVAVRRRIDAKEVGVRAVTTGSPPQEYWLSGLSVDPSGVTIQGNPNVIAEMGSFVDTVPVDLSEAVGDLAVEVPLDLPPEVRALDRSGNAVSTVRVLARVEPLTGDLLIPRQVELIKDSGTLTITLLPPEIELLLTGPLPQLNEIEANPELVRVIIDASTLSPGESVELIPDVIRPEDVQYQLIQSPVLVTTAP